MEFIETPNKRHIADNLSYRYGVSTFFLKEEFIPFEEAREFARSLKLKNIKKWNRYCKSGERPNDIPAGPRNTYENKGWINWGDWLGTGRSYGGWLPFEEARNFAKKLKLKNKNEWKEYCRSGERPDNIPSLPSSIYKNEGWINWGDFLGTRRQTRRSRGRDFLPFEEAREFIRSLEFKNQNGWMTYRKLVNRPNNIPSNPNIIYKDKGWIGTRDWLGTKK